MQHRKALLPLVVLGSIVTAASSLRTPSPLASARDLSRVFREVVSDVSPSVVGIESRYRDDVSEFAGRRVARGSGVIVRPNGKIVTNHHVVDGAYLVLVTLPDERVVTARVLGTDPETDLALLDIDARDLTSARLGGSAPPEVGEWVLAVGNPYGLERSVTAGIVSGLGRSDLDITTYEDFIQTDAAINSGNSGGALVDLTGAVVGINTAKGTRTAGSLGLGFAIPAHIVREVVEAVLTDGRVRRGWMGISMRELAPQLASRFGLEKRKFVMVQRVFEGPAERAGLLEGDIILRVDGRRPADMQDLLMMVARLAPGALVPVDYWRERQRYRAQVRMGERDPLE